jgi:hypothetical protein
MVVYQNARKLKNIKVEQQIKNRTGYQHIKQPTLLNIKS